MHGQYNQRHIHRKEGTQDKMFPDNAKAVNVFILNFTPPWFEVTLVKEIEK